MAVTFRGVEMNMESAPVLAFTPEGETELHFFVGNRLIGTASHIRSFIEKCEDEAGDDFASRVISVVKKAQRERRI